MNKRVVAVFFTLSAVMGFLFLRIISLGESKYAGSAQENHSMSMELSALRGNIFDANGLPLVNEKTLLVAAARPTAAAAAELENLAEEPERTELRERLQKGYPVSFLPMQTKSDCPDVLITGIRKRYTDTQPAAHIIGYLGADGQGVSGLELCYNRYLQEQSGRLSAYFPTDAQGRVLAGGSMQLKTENYYSAAGLQLTLDKRIQEIVEAAMNQPYIAAGVAVVLENETGAIRAMCSRPDFNPNNLAESLQAQNAPLINRALHSFPVGSVFKPILAAAAIEQGVDTALSFHCTGEIKIGSHTFRCHKRDGHGVMDLASAISESCNPYFINLMQHTQPSEVLPLVQAFGFGREITLAPGLIASKGNMPNAQALSAPAAYANFSFGQGDLSATPLQLAAAFACFAAKGQYRTPYLIQGFLDENGTGYDTTKAAAPEQILRPETAELMRQLLVQTVTSGSGQRALPAQGGAGGKTATAQTGVFENGEEKVNVWFAGFFPAEQPKYTAVIMIEDGRSGASDCAPIFKAIADGVQFPN